MNGASKSARAAAKRAAANQPPAPLDPAFPFVPVPFDAFYFGVNRDAAERLAEAATNPS